jgi:curved DNA-binding protein CbpA
MSNRGTLDPYAVLGVPRDATLLQVARAHRRLAKRYHPDLNPDADTVERMRRVNEAWRILSTSVRRAEFDRSNPLAGTGRSGHWVGSRTTVQPAPPTSTRTWASWRASAAEIRTAPRGRRAPGEEPAPRTRRPERIVAQPDTFRDSAWAAIAVAAVIIFLLVAAVAINRLT